MSADTRAPVRVLVVDDDPTIVRAYGDALKREGFDVLTAASCRDAMNQVDGAKGGIPVFVVDFSLPDGDGADFVKEASAKYGDRATMYITGWADEFWQLQDTPGRWIVMRKPVALKKLAAGVRWLAHGGAKPAELDED